MYSRVFILAWSILLAGLVMSRWGLPPLGRVRVATADANQGDYPRRVCIGRGRILLFGRIDARGNFIQEKKVGPISGLVFPIISTAGEELINTARWQAEWLSESVYEYRSGVLIPGRIDGSDRFIPERGSKVVSFYDYCPGSGAPRIYNLPGHLLPKNGKQ